MLIESLSVLGIGLGLAYGLDKFMGTGIFSWKEKVPSSLMRSDEDALSIKKNIVNRNDMVNKMYAAGTYYGGKHKSKTRHVETKIHNPHPVIVNYMNNLYKKSKKK